MPRHPERRAWGNLLRGVLGWSALALLVWAIRGTLARRRDRWLRWSDSLIPPARRKAVGRALAWAALAGILAHGAMLRLDAITARYGPVTSPRWLAALQTRGLARPESLRPASLHWGPEEFYPHRDGVATHYYSDPYIYLDAARHMSSFYTAHFREPLFPFATRTFLRLLDGQDVAVSFASAFFSVLAIWLTYILGAAVWSRPAGLLAALGLSLDGDVISHASLGWRDDAYVAVVVLCAYLMLRCWRVMQQGAAVRRLGRLQIDAAYLEAVVLGVASGLAILTRIMAVSFLVAGVGSLAFVPRASWRKRLSVLGITTVTALLVSAPYFVNCWRQFGDPFYTFNVHGKIYGAAEGQDWNGSTAGYVSQKVLSQPVETVDVVAQGLTTYPFTNKWHGLDVWHAGLGEWASAAAIMGIVLLAASTGGRLLLIAMVGSLIPFSFTWVVDPNFRFTEHAYPALLIAAAVTIDVACRGALAILVPQRPSAPAGRWSPTSWLAWATVVGIGAAGLWFVTRASPSWIFHQTLSARETAMVTAGARDTAFFSRGWSDVLRAGNVVSLRVANADGVLSLPLPGVSDYTVAVRMDPFPRPMDNAPTRLPVVDVTINGAPVDAVALQWKVDRVGAYEFVLPRALVHPGANQLGFHVRRPALPPEAIRPGITDGDAISLWYVRVSAGSR
jgi:4-amino-4-deoxy-L-arabinose transferase-like glycosyltransferase